jgi:hypothetical protein
MYIEGQPMTVAVSVWKCLKYTNISAPWEMLLHFIQLPAEIKIYARVINNPRNQVLIALTVKLSNQALNPTKSLTSHNE